MSKHYRQYNKILKALPKFPTLRTETEVAEIYKEKVKLLLKDQFSPPAAARLDDIDTAIYPPEISLLQRVTQEKVISIIKELKPDKAPGVDSIPNHILQMVLGEWSLYFTYLF